MPPINLLHPAMLFGLGLLGLPIAAHFLNRRARKVMVFPTIELLRASSASQSTLFKFRRWLLLLLRVLAVLFIILAFCRPQLEKRSPLAASNSKGGAYVLIMFDRSMSTGQIVNGTPAADILRAKAIGLLDDLDAGTDNLNLLFLDNPPKLMSDEYTRNIDLIRDEINKVTPGNGLGDVGPALAMAGNSLKNAPGNRHLIIVSDMQETNWIDYPSDALIKAELPEGTRITLLSLESDAPGNIGLSAPDVIPSKPLVGETCIARVLVSNGGPDEKSAIVELYNGETLIETQAVRLLPWTKDHVGFNLRIDDPEILQLRFEIENDALPADNVAYLPIIPGKHIPILILGTDNPARPGSSTYFLSRTLAPYTETVNRYTITTKSTTAFTPQDGKSAEIIILSDSAPVEEQLRNLENHVKQGGKLILVAGHRYAGKIVEILEASAEMQLFPFQMVAYEDLKKVRRFTTISGVDMDSPVFRDYDPSARTALSQVHIWRRWKTSAREGHKQLNILDYPDGDVAGCIVEHGKGHIALLNFSPRKDAGDLAQHGTYVALMQSIVGYFQNISGRTPTYLPNDFVQMQLKELKSGGDLPRIFKPDKTPIHSVDFQVEEGNYGFSVQETSEPGFYNVDLAGRLMTTFAVNCDSRESHLRRLTLNAAVAPETDAVTTSTAGFHGSLPNWKPHPVWGWMIMVALGILAVEAIILRFWIREGTT